MTDVTSQFNQKRSGDNHHALRQLTRPNKEVRMNLIHVSIHPFVLHGYEKNLGNWGFGS